MTADLAERLRTIVSAQTWTYDAALLREVADAFAAKDERIVNLERQRAAQRDRLAAAERVVEAARVRCDRMAPHHDELCWVLMAIEATEAYSSEREQQPNMRLTKAQSKALADDLGLSDLNFSKREGDSAGARVVPADFKTPADSPDAE